METYKKPIIVNNDSTYGIIPLAAAPLAAIGAATAATSAASAVGAAAVSAALAAGVFMGLRKGNNVIISGLTNSLTLRKDFS